MNKVAIFTDSHALLEPTQAILEDIQKRNITQIYSLGDNIGVGPNPSEVMDLLEEYGIISLAGNSEEYVTLGYQPFRSYFHSEKQKSLQWTLSQLSDHQKYQISLYPHSIELCMGHKKIGLCHFANDVRIDFGVRSTWSYQSRIREGKPGYSQFSYTNSIEQLKEIKQMLSSYDETDDFMKGYLSYQQDALFGGKKVDQFDAIIQGHVHFKLYERSLRTEYYTIRAAGMAYEKNEEDKASYVMLTETKKGYSLEEVLVPYDREKMLSSIASSTSPDYMIKKFVNMPTDYKSYR